MLLTISINPVIDSLSQACPEPNLIQIEASQFCLEACLLCFS